MITTTNNIFTTASVVVIVILLVILLILLLVRKPIDSSASDTVAISKESVPIVLIANEQITIVSKTADCNLVNYCKSWGYKYNTKESGIVLYLNDDVSNINTELPLNLFIHLLDDMSYIAFADSETYITQKHTSLSQIKDEISQLELPQDTANDILANGYPYMTANGIILSKNYLFNIFRSEMLQFTMPLIMPRIIPARKSSTKVSRKSKIPKIIHQTFETQFIPTSLYNAAYSWIARNPDYEYRYYDDRTRRTYIQQHFDSKVLQAYDKLIPGAYRADLWRYCVIYQDGGVYADIKTGALLPLSKIINEDSNVIIVNDHLKGAIYNGFFAAIPKHPALLQCIQIAVDRVLNGEYGEYNLYTTGPIAMGDAFIKYRNDQSLKITTYNYYTEDNQLYIKNDLGDRLVIFRHSSNITEDNMKLITGRPHYRELWKDRNIYRQ